MDQDPGHLVAQGNDFTIGHSDHLAKPRPVSTTIRHLDDHLFVGSAPAKLINDLTFVY